MKRILSLLVVFAMVISMIPSVFAADSEIDFDELSGKLVNLDSVEMIDVAMEASLMARIYKWTPAEAGLLVMYVYGELPEGTALSMTQGDNSVTYNTEDAFELAVEANAEVSIKVTKTSDAALSFTMEGVLQPPRGSQENPVVLWDLENEVTANGPEGITWFQGFFNGTTMTVTGTGEYNVTVNSEPTAAVDGVVTMEVVTPNPRMPFVFSIDKAGEYTIKFEYPQGTQMNPEILFRPNYIAVNIAEGNSQGYYYKWTSNTDGALKLTCPAVEGVEYDVMMTNMSNYAMAWLSDSEDGTVSIDMKAGDEIIIQVAAAPDADWNYPALETALMGEVIFPIGSQMNPEILFRPNYIAVNVAEGNSQGYYYKWTSNTDGALKLTCPTVEGVEYDVIMTNMSSWAMAWLSDSEDGTVSIDMKAGDEIVIQVVAAPDADWNYPALETALMGEVIFPIGSQMNPEVLFRPNYIVVNVAEGNSQGYYYKWTSNTDGALKLTCPAVEGVEYDVIMTNMSSYAMAWLSDSEDGTVSIDMKAGDEIIIQVVAAPDANWNYPALETALMGEVIYPIGSQMNPEVLTSVESINVNVAEGNSQGYYYKWMSDINGVLTLTCPTVEGVEYDVIMTNMSSWAMAWLSDSEDGTVSIDMKAGDEIIIQVVAAPDADWNYPALETALTGVATEITYTPGDLDGNDKINEDDAIYLLQHVMMPDLFKVDQPADVDGNGAVNEDDAIYLLQHVMMPGLFPLK